MLTQIKIISDSLIAKLITKADTRPQALKKMDRALGEFMIEPIKTTIPFCRAVINDPDFKRGKYHTGFLNKFIKNIEE